MRSILYALLLLLLAAGTAVAAPALWVATGEGGTVYLFGTVHLLRPDASWRSPALDAALHRADAVEFELAKVDPAEAVSFVQQLGLDPLHPLSATLSKADWEAFDRAVRANGLGEAEKFDALRPWAAAAMLASRVERRAGFQTDLGVETVLRAEAVAAGKPVLGLETMGQQVHFLADMTEQQQVLFLESALKQTSVGLAKLDALVQAWQRGDVDALDMRHTLEQASLYERLLVERNRTWVAAIEARLRQPGTLLVAVGAAHLAGPDGLPSLLARDGFKVERIQ